MKDRVGRTRMNGTEGEQSHGVVASCQLDDVVEQANSDARLPFPDIEGLEKTRRARAREAMEV